MFHRSKFVKTIGCTLPYFKLSSLWSEIGTTLPLVCDIKLEIIGLVHAPAKLLNNRFYEWLNNLVNTIGDFCKRTTVTKRSCHSFFERLVQCFKANYCAKLLYFVVGMNYETTCRIIFLICFEALLRGNLSNVSSNKFWGTFEVLW